MKINVDTHERAKFPYLDAYFKHNKMLKLVTGYTIENMPTGDYGTPYYTVGIERKAEDFVPSMYSNLKQQLKELRDAYKHPYLLVEYDGIIDCATKTNTDVEVIIGQVASCLSHSRVPLIWVGDFFISQMLRIIEKECDGKEYEVDKMYTPVRRITTKGHLKVNIIASAFHGLGVSDILAQRLLDRFDSVENTINATVKELTEVEGIGKVKAKKMKAVLK